MKDKIFVNWIDNWFEVYYVTFKININDTIDDITFSYKYEIPIHITSEIQNILTKTYESKHSAYYEIRKIVDEYIEKNYPEIII